MKHFISIITLFLLFSCGSKEAQPIKLHVDSCDFCKMTISDPKFGAEVITQKGRVYKFDDIMCMVNYCKADAETKIEAFYVLDYTQNNVLIPAETSFFLKGGDIQSPMHGGIIAFSSEKESKEFETKLNAEPITWNAIMTK